MKTETKVALAMSADGQSFEEVHDSIIKIIDQESIKFAKWCLLKKYVGRGYDWENVQLLYEIYNDERKSNPDMDL